MCLSLPLPDFQCLQVRAHELHFSVSHAWGSAWPIVGAQSMHSIRIVKGMIKTDDKKKRHRFIEQSFRLCGRRRGRDVSREQHRNLYTVKGESDYRPRLDA